MPRLFAALACLVMLASCAPTERPAAAAWRTETALVTNMGGEPDTIDPQKVSFENEMSIVGMLYEPLLTWDAATLTLVPAAARALPRVTNGGRIYTYMLRDGLTYSDGLPVTAQRYVDAFVRLCDPSVYGEYAFIAFPIVGCSDLYTTDPKKASADALAAARASVGVRALDALTIEFRLAAPSASFPQATAMPVGVPIRIEDVARWTTDGLHASHDASAYVGNGPFVLSEWSTTRMVFERNDRYRLPVRLARWTKLEIGDPDTARALYDAGLLDVVGVGPRDASDREALLARRDLARTLGTCMSYIGFNTQRPPFDDPNVRMAFAKAIDKDAFASSLGVGVHVAPSFVAHDTPGHAHNDRTQDFDPVAARHLLAESKYGTPSDGNLAGMEMKFTFQDNGGPLRQLVRKRIDWIVEQWRANLGVVVHPDPVDTTSYGPFIKRPEQLPLLRWMSWCADYPDGDAWYQNFTKDGPGAHALAFTDPEYDALIASAKTELDPLARERIYDAASFRLSQQAPGAWISWSERWWLVSRKVSGYDLSAFDWDFAQFSLARIVGVGR